MVGDSDVDNCCRSSRDRRPLGATSSADLPRFAVDGESVCHHDAVNRVDESSALWDDTAVACDRHGKESIVDEGHVGLDQGARGQVWSAWVLVSVAAVPSSCRGVSCILLWRRVVWRKST